MEEGRKKNNNPHLASSRRNDPTCQNFGDCLVGVWREFGNCLYYGETNVARINVTYMIINYCKVGEFIFIYIQSKYDIQYTYDII